MAIEQAPTIQCVNPATRKEIWPVPCLDRAAVDVAVRKAWSAFESWRLTDYSLRAKKILNLRRVITAQADTIAALISLETGKPSCESYLADITGPLDACVYFAENTERLLRDQVVNLSNLLLSSKQSLVSFEPLGVVAVIAPWNYPFAIPMMTIIMAVMAGNSVVLKPSEKANLIGIRIGELFAAAGFPPELVTVVTGDKSTGSALVAAGVQKVIFTGSVAGGSQVMQAAAGNLTPVTLELGGKDAAIVLPDAPLDWTAQGIVWGAMTNCGQACASIERLYIVKSKDTQQLISTIVSRVEQLKLGPGLDPATDVGPLIDEAQLAQVDSQVKEAQAMGARILCGGRRRDDLGGFFYEPTVLTQVNHSMKIMTEETFGPVLPIMLAESEDEAVELANDSQFGLTASIWSGNLSGAEDIARDLDAGTVYINDCLFSFACPQVPWGGMKKSGSGRSHSYFGLLDLVHLKHISIDSAGGAHRLWWYPYGKDKLELARSGLEFMHGTSVAARLRGLARFAGKMIFGRQ